MTWCERKGIGYIFGLAGNPVLLRQVGPLAENAALGRLAGEGEKVRRYGDFRYAAKSWTSRAPRRRPRRGRSPGRRQPLHRHQSAGPAQGALRESLLCQGTGGKPSDQGAQAAPRLRPNLLPQSDRQPVPPADPHGGLLAAAEPARLGAPHLVLARRPVRHDPALPDQGRRPRHRDGHPHQARPADRLSLPGRLRRTCPRHRQTAAVNNGAIRPRTNPSAQPPTPLTCVIGPNYAPVSAVTRSNSTPVNDPG